MIVFGVLDSLYDGLLDGCGGIVVLRLICRTVGGSQNPMHHKIPGCGSVESHNVGSDV